MASVVWLALERPDVVAFGADRIHNLRAFEDALAIRKASRTGASLAVVGAALVFLVPTCAYPTGAIVHEHRRHEILATVAEHDVLLVEDLTPADLVFGKPAPPPFVSMTLVTR